MSFIEEYKNNFFISEKNLFYPLESINNEYLFSHPKDLLKRKNTKTIIIDESSSSEEEFIYADYDYDGDCCGGAKKVKSKSKSQSKLKSKKNKLTVVPTFINVIKGKIIYTNQTKLNLEPLKQKDNKNVILGTIIDINNIKEEIKNKNDLMNYFKKYNVLPVLFNFENKNIINKNKKKTFFSSNSKLMFVLFKIKNNYSYYKEVIEKSPYEKFQNISEILKEKNYIIAHYIYENYYMFLNNKKHDFEIHECYAIDKNYNFIEQNLSSLNTVNLSDKIFLDDFTELLNNCKNYLTKFS